MSKTVNTSVRLTSRQHAYLRANALAKGRSLNAELGDIIEETTKACPITFVIRHRKTDSVGELYTAAIGEGADDFYEGKSEDEAHEATRAKIRELGLKYRDVKIERRTETPDAEWRAR